MGILSIEAMTFARGVHESQQRRKYTNNPYTDHLAADVRGMPEPYRTTLCAGGGPVWLEAVSAALRALGGEADVQAPDRKGIHERLPSANIP